MRPTYATVQNSKVWHFDPLGQPKVTTGSDHYFRTRCLSVCPYPLLKILKNIAILK